MTMHSWLHHFLAQGANQISLIHITVLTLLVLTAMCKWKSYSYFWLEYAGITRFSFINFFKVRVDSMFLTSIFLMIINVSFVFNGLAIVLTASWVFLKIFNFHSTYCSYLARCLIFSYPVCCLISGLAARIVIWKLLNYAICQYANSE